MAPISAGRAPDQNRRAGRRADRGMVNGFRRFMTTLISQAWRSWLRFGWGDLDVATTQTLAPVERFTPLASSAGQADRLSGFHHNGWLDPTPHRSGSPRPTTFGVGPSALSVSAIHALAPPALDEEWSMRRRGRRGSLERNAPYRWLCIACMRARMGRAPQVFLNQSWPTLHLARAPQLPSGRTTEAR